jgi:hypothetical protein
VLNPLQLALNGGTVRLGSLLASAGISTIVVMNASAPELAGVQTVPLHAVPVGIKTALGLQTDLSLELQTSAVEVYSNSMFRGLVTQTLAGSKEPKALFASTSTSGPVAAGSVVRAGLAPASAFALDVNGLASSRTTSDGWVPTYKVNAAATNPTGELVLRQFPLNGILAGFTLSLWILVWLGFGLIQRLEWLFTGRHRTGVVARHAKRDKRG